MRISTVINAYTCYMPVHLLQRLCLDLLGPLSASREGTACAFLLFALSVRDFEWIEKDWSLLRYFLMARRSYSLKGALRYRDGPFVLTHMGSTRYPTTWNG